MGFQNHGTQLNVTRDVPTGGRYFGICAERLDEPWNNNDPRLNCVIYAAIVQRAVRFDNLFRNVRAHPPVTVHINGRGLFIMKRLLADRRARSIYSSIGTSKMLSVHKSHEFGRSVVALISLVISNIVTLTLRFALKTICIICYKSCVNDSACVKFRSGRYFGISHKRKVFRYLIGRTEEC